MGDYERLLADNIARLQTLTQKKKGLLKQIEEIEREELGLGQAIEGYQFIVGKAGTLTKFTDPRTAGFTDAIRNMFKGSPLFPTYIRDALEKAGYERNSPKTLLINVHNTIKRLID